VQQKLQGACNRAGGTGDALSKSVHRKRAEKTGGKGRHDLLVIPLFPHYAMSSYESAVERVKEVAAKIAPNFH
jgi:protoheme ferro-lyase